MREKAAQFIEQVQRLCGRSLDPTVLEDARDRLVTFFEIEGVNGEFGHRQLNEVLLLLNERIVTEGFFRLLAGLGDKPGKETIAFEKFSFKIQEFHKLAMLKYGSFRFAYNFLSTEKEPELHFKEWLRSPVELKHLFKKRKKPLCEIEQIPVEDIHHIGYYSSTKSNRAVKNKVRAVGRRNFETYLTWDYLDVYVATSMRRPFEYRAVHRLCETVFNTSKMKSIGVRYFDPTLNFHEDSIAKSLIEGLMLKRAKCTLYLAQESDTMGKDSELAATLAQGKPVIAFVPSITKVGERMKQLKKADLDEVIVLANVVEESVTDTDQDEFQRCSELIGEIALRKVSAKTKQQLLANHKSEYDRLVELVAKYEQTFYDNRADKLKYAHPLRFQMDLQTGVANGVLVARSPKECEELLYKLLTCSLEFEIISPGEDCPDKAKFGAALKYNHILLEKSTRSAFRVVTTDEKLTNSFWNLYKREDL